jgi:hypothetical protein
MVAVRVMMTMRAMRFTVARMNVGIASKTFEKAGTGKTRDDRAKEWKKYNCLNHGSPDQPFIRLISSTAMVPRLRK